MKLTLPVFKSSFWFFLSQLLLKVKGLLGQKQARYRLAAVLDLILMIAILIAGRQPAQRLMSPVVTSISSFYSTYTHRTTSESFAFVPGLARNKFSDVTLEGLNYLSFFDVPITENGEINRDSRGYASFTSAEASELFDRARYQKAKVLLTLSALSPGTVASVLDNNNAWQTLADDTVSEIQGSNVDGVTFDFEFPYGQGRDYQEKFTNFIEFITGRIHDVLPQALVTVAVPSASVNNNSLYNIEALGKNSDRLFLIASDLIVPEVQNSSVSNPVYGFSENEYWAKVSNLLGNLLQRVSASRLTMERAWYGNGNNYPLYVPNSTNSFSGRGSGASGVQMDQATLETLVVGVPDKGKEAARRNIPLITQALQDEGILDSNVLAYALATVEHETDETFEPIAEIQGPISARRLGYEGGADYYGRGFIQITHLRNYRQIGERIGFGEELVKNPDLALKPEISAKILAAFFKDNNVANLASRGNFVAARTPINPDYNGYSVANLAMKYEVY